MAEISEAALLAAQQESLQRLGEALHTTLVANEFAVSQERVPRLTTELAQTGYVIGPFFEAGAVWCQIGYGSAEAGDTGIYAIVQHERQDFAHPNGGQAKYLESAVVEGQPTLLQRIATEMERPGSMVFP